MKFWRLSAACAKESVCIPVSHRRDMGPKDCLIHLLTVYFSHPHIRLNLHSIARCDMGNLHPHLRDLVSPQEDQDACQVQKALLLVSTFHVLLSLPPAQTLSISGEELLVYLAFFLAPVMGWVNSDCILMPTCKIQEQYALRLVAAFYIVLIFNTVKPEFPGY